MFRKLLFGAVLLVSFVASAQKRQFVFTRLSTKEGLASNIVYSVMQDKRGFMWLATANGLQRYDGRKVIYFRVPQQEENYLPSTAISQIFEDINGNFWVRAEKEVGIFDPATFRYRRAQIRMAEDVLSRSDFELKHDSRGNVFLLLRRAAILTYNKEKNEFAPEYNPFETPPGWKINQFVEDPVTKNYWMGGDSGLAIYDVKKRDLYYRGKNPLQIPLLNDSDYNSYISAFYIDRQHKAWIVSWPSHRTGERFYCYDLKANRLVNETNGLYISTEAYHELHSFFQQENNELWAFGRRLLFHKKDPSGVFQYMRNEHIDEYGIRYDIVHNVFEDREHNVWLATDQGVYIVNTAAQPFTSIAYEGINNKPGDRSVTSFSESQHQLLVGTWGNGVLSYDSLLHPEKNNFVTPAIIKKDPNYSLIWTLLTEKNGKRIWAGCQAGRLIVYDVATDKATYFNPSIFEIKTIRQIVQDKLDNIWVGSQYGHLVKWEQKKGAFDPNGLLLVKEFNSIIYKLYIDNGGFLWACTSLYGVFKFDPATGKQLAQYHSKLGPGKSLYANAASDIVQYNDSLYFVASGGLNLLNVNTGKIELLTDQGFATHSIKSLALDSTGMLWIGSLNGLSRFNLKRKNFTHFSQKDGVLSNDFLVGASFKRQNGQLLFGNANDFVIFDPADVSRSTAPPDVSITDFKIFNTYIPPDSILKLDKVRLDPKQNSITIEFAALSFLEKDKMIYYFKLDGVDKEWIRTERLQVANYTLLPAGNYTFMVRCENGDGIPSAGVTTLKIFIRPPFWQTWWFLLLALLGVASVIYLVHRVRVNRIIDMQKVRTRIARDLHDDMGSTLSTINILSEMAKMKVHSDTSKTDEYLHKISDNSSRMMEAMDDIVWSINPLNDSMAKITARMREFATGVLEAKNIDFTFHVDEAVKELKLDMEARRDFFLLFKEAVNNLAKYSDCRHAAIDIQVHRSTLLMKIRDDGKGFDVQAADSGNGLTNMKKRAQSLNGNLQIESAPNSGTLVALEVPLAS